LADVKKSLEGGCSNYGIDVYVWLWCRIEEDEQVEQRVREKFHNKNHCAVQWHRKSFNHCVIAWQQKSSTFCSIQWQRTSSTTVYASLFTDNFCHLIKG